MSDPVMSLSDGVVSSFIAWWPEVILAVMALDARPHCLGRPSSEAVPRKSVSLCRYMGRVDSWHSGVRLWSMVDSLKVWYKWASWGVRPCWKAGGLMVFGQKSAESLGKPSRAFARPRQLSPWLTLWGAAFRRCLMGVTLGVLKLVVQAGTPLSMSWSRVLCRDVRSHLG